MKQHASTSAQAPPPQEEWKEVGGLLWDSRVEPLLLSLNGDDDNGRTTRTLLILPHRTRCTCWDTATGMRVAELQLQPSAGSDNDMTTHSDDDDDDDNEPISDEHNEQEDRRTNRAMLLRVGSLSLHPNGRHIWVGCRSSGRSAAGIQLQPPPPTLQVFDVADLQQQARRSVGGVVVLHPVAQMRWTNIDALPGTGTTSTASTLWDIRRINFVPKEGKTQLHIKSAVESGNPTCTTSTAAIRANSSHTVMYAIMVQKAALSSEGTTTSKRQNHHQAHIVRTVVEDSDCFDNHSDAATAAVLDSTSTNRAIQVLDTHPSYEREQGHLLLHACKTTATTNNAAVLVFANSSKLRVLCCRDVLKIDQAAEETATGDSSDKHENDNGDDASELPIQVTQPQKPNTIPSGAVRTVDLESLFLERGGRITACHVLPNETDVVVGDWEGAIFVLHEALPRCIEYCAGPHYQPTVPSPVAFPPNHPCNINNINPIVVRKLHWHVHPIQALTSDATGRTLYSGGEESVLCAWSLDRAINANQPSQLLPRTALQGIRQIVVLSGSDNGGGMEDVVVYTGDNVLQRFDPVHNWRRVWNVRGLATRSRSRLPSSLPVLPRMSRGDASSPDPVVALWGLPGAPGQLHFYHVQKQQCVQTLEVVPWNRVSQTYRQHRQRRHRDRNGQQDPGILATATSPTVTHTAFSDQCLLTVDEVPTENGALGAARVPSLSRQPSHSGGSLVTTLRFWQRDSSHPNRNAYQLVAAMPHPHGRFHRVSGLALHGPLAATVSAQERAIRLWQKQPEHSSSSPHNSEFVWTCRCKVTVPSGYANFCQPDLLITHLSFSSDASVLAVTFGSHVTLWDHREEVTLLGALRHDRPNENIDRMEFVTSTHLVDMVLTQSSTAVTLQSPSGSTGGPAGWNWLVVEDDDHLQISRVEFLPESELVAIVLQRNLSPTSTTFYDVESRIVLVDAISGACQMRLSPISGHVVAMTSLPGRGGDSRSTEASLLYALTSRGEMVCFKEKSGRDDNDSIGEALLKATEPAVPTLPLLAATATKPSGRKRSMSVLQVNDLQVASSTKRSLLSLRNFFGPATDVGGDSATELPMLRGAFARSFVARHLQQPQGE